MRWSSWFSSSSSPSFSSRAALLAFVCGVGLFFSSRSAEAYPQFQFSSGTSRCAQCHYSPAGYGLLTAWGRDESADTISRGGDGAFLHGLWAPPDWLALGGDLRFAAVRNNVGGDGSPESAVFPMQAELYGRVAFGDSGVSLYVAGGARSATRPEMTGGTVRVVSAISREHYLMWKPSATGAYVRAGRFYAPFGLRMAEHIYFIRRHMGFNLYEETYNLSGGYLDEDWEVHATAFTKVPAGLPEVLQASGMRGAGGALYGEKRFASIAGVGLQGRVMVNAEQRLTQGGGVGKLWVEQAKMLVMSEVNLQRRDIIGGQGVNQMVAFFGLTFIPIKGVMAGIAAERYQEDLRLATTARNAFDLQINLFPWAHFEVFLLGRYQMAHGGSANGDPGSLGMLQLHYYL